jgi:hypothetical protein
MLPQNSLSNSDRQILDTIKSQNAHLDAQTRVLHTLSDSIMSFKRDQKKDYNSLRNDIKTMQREFFTGNAKGMSDIKKYFEKTKNNRPETSFNKEKDTDKGFFRSAINKLFGPSKYQQKMIDEISMLREITEIQATDIGFIKKQYEEGPRARERELLAQAIANKLNLNGGDNNGKGMLGMLGGLVSALGGILGGLGAVITAAIAAGFAILKGLIEALLGAKGLGAGLPPDGPDRKDKGGRGPIPTEEPGRVPTPGGPIPSPVPGGGGSSSPRLPAPDVPRLPGPSGQEKAGKIEDIMRERQQQKAGGVTDVKPKIPGGMAGGKLAGRIALRAIPYVGWALLAAELGYEAYKFFGEPNGKTPAVDPTKFDKSAGGPDDLTGILQANSEKTVESTGDLNDALKLAIGSVMAFEQKMEEVADSIGKAVLEKAVPFLNKAGEITLSNGQSINLLPNLGTSTAEVLDGIYEDTKDLAKAGMDATGMTPIINNIVNQAVPNNSISMPMVAAAAAATGVGISRYLNRKGKIR